MQQARENEIDTNFRYFETVVSGLVRDNAGRYALLHDCSVIGIFDKPAQAMREGEHRFGTGHYSIQAITDVPADLGFYSHVFDFGPRP